MERLSDRAIAIVNELHTERLDYQSEYLPCIDALNRLAAYEETGLTPEEIKASRHISAIVTAVAIQDAALYDDSALARADQLIERLERDLKRYRESEEDGRLLVLPCKVGDTVYATNHHGRIVDGKVQSIHQNYVAGKAGRWVVSVYYPEYNGTAESGLHPDFLPMNMYYGLDDFGKTVFLTREEAETALKGGTDHAE